MWLIFLEFEKNRGAKYKKVRNHVMTAQAYISSAVLVVSTALLCTILMGNGSRTAWYACIRPKYTPPSKMFSVVWIALYAIIAVVLGRAIDRRETVAARLLLVHLLLGVLWSGLFWAKKHVVLAAGVMVLKLASLLAVMKSLWASGDRTSVYLLAPYMAWLLYATFLSMSAIKRAKVCRKKIAGDRR